MAALWLALLALPGAACAQQAQLCATSGGTLQALLAAAPACQSDAAFLAALGQLLNRDGRYLEAADHLERALMLAPDLQDAQLSYAIALAGSGDAPSAAALLDNLLADPALPAPLRRLINQQRLALSVRPDPAGWQRRFALGARLGYDSNLLGSPNLDSLALTLSGQTLVLPLDASYLARSGGYVRAEAQAQLHRNAPNDVRWDAVASLRSRHSPAVPEAGSSQLDLLLERSHVAPRGAGSYLNVSGSRLESKAGVQYLTWGAAGGGVWHSEATSGCQARAGVEWQVRSYLDNPVLSGRYAGLSAFWSCEQPSGAQWLLGLKAGRDAAQDGARPGGDQRHASLRLAGFVPLQPLSATLQRGGLLLDFEHSQQADSSGYSPIIDSGATRSVRRRAARLEYQQPLWGTMWWVLGAEWVAQTSNLALFGQDSYGGYSGVRLGW